MTKWTAYVDESGTNTQSRHFVLACIMGNPDNLAKLTNTLYGLKLGMAPNVDPDTWELHARKMRHTPVFRKGHASVWPRATSGRNAVLYNIVHLLCKTGVRVFFIVITKDKIHHKRGDTSVLTKYALTFLLERIEHFLRSRGEDDVGEVVFDDPRPNMRDAIDETFADLAGGRSALSKVSIGRIGKIGYAHSDASVPLQAADTAAYVVGRHMSGGDDMAEAFGWIEEMVWSDGKWSGSKVI